MQLSEVGSLLEARGSKEANEKLADGWELLAVVPGIVPDATSHVIYVLGRKKGDAAVDAVEALARQSGIG